MVVPLPRALPRSRLVDRRRADAEPAPAPLPRLPPESALPRRADRAWEEASTPPAPALALGPPPALRITSALNDCTSFTMRRLRSPLLSFCFSKSNSNVSSNSGSGSVY